MKTEFDPKIHGYKFPNRFEKNWPDLIIKLVLRDSVYGLCGGMVYSALDHFLHKAELIDTPTVDQLQPAYIQYLWQRQRASMPVLNYPLLFSKAFQSDEKLLHNALMVQIPRAIETINSGIPAAIIIIRSKYFHKPTDNHQILLTGYQIDGPVTTFFCYDPNHPGRTTELVINRMSGKESIKQSTGEMIRGFFVNSYKKAGIGDW